MRSIQRRASRAARPRSALFGSRRHAARDGARARCSGAAFGRRGLWRADSGRELVARAVHTLEHRQARSSSSIAPCRRPISSASCSARRARDETGRHAALERVAAASAFYRAQHGTLYLTNLIRGARPRAGAAFRACGAIAKPSSLTAR
jgi:hypothetical protein